MDNFYKCIGFLTVVLCLASMQGTCGEPSRKDARGPLFRMEPPPLVEFSNNSGAEPRCSADGFPLPRIAWLAREGGVAREVPGLRTVRSDATLVFHPFPRNEYRQDVHDAVYQCSASNPAGIVLSREVHVRGGVVDADSRLDCQKICQKDIVTHLFQDHFSDSCI